MFGFAQPTISGLEQTLGTPQQALAQQAQKNFIEQAISSGNGDNLIKQLKAASTPRSPQLKFDVDATGIGDGAIAGLGNVFNNAMQMRNFNQQRQEEQNRLDLAAYNDLAIADKKKRNIEIGNQNLRTLFPGATPEQITALQASNTASEGKLFDTMAQGFGTQQIDIGGIGPKAKATADAKLANAGTEGQAETKQKFTASQGMSDLIRKDILDTFGVDIYGQAVNKAQIPANVRNRLIQLGVEEPEDYLTDIERQAKASSAQSGATIDSINAQTLPTEKKQEIQSKELEFTMKKVEAKYQEALILIDKLTGENKLDEANELKGRLTEGRARYDKAVAMYDTLTPGQIKLINSQMKSMQLPYELPEKKENKLTPIKHKGKVTGFTDNEGHVYDADGNPKG